TEAVTDHDRQTGGSTITMPVAKNYFLSPERTLNRKLTELFLARKIEDELSKNDILTLYVNKIYLGEGAYGIRAAAKKYYSKSLDNLT
ncbi:biosynthetic peptidoglycan transglycosylase, partial [Pseudoalteromonas sp. SIMBA_153]